MLKNVKQNNDSYAKNDTFVLGYKMKVNFQKYQGTGNDFVMIDNRSGEYDNLTLLQIRNICDRKFGVGADGLIKINSKKDSDYEVDYYNADGTKSFCGNGARCAVEFARTLGIDKTPAQFVAIDGNHSAEVLNGLIKLKMANVSGFELELGDYVLETGSPHYLRFVDSVAETDIVSFGQSIRFSESYKENGINVNVIEEVDSSKIRIRTYERGVEDETLSCGTGATAAAMAFAVKNELDGELEIQVQVEGGELIVSFIRSGREFESVYLTGPATYVFTGEIHV